MAEIKRYFWLKLQNDFFDSLRIKKLRKIAGGDTYTIIYLKMQLLSLKKDGVLTYTGVENSLAEELALDLDEDAENVSVTLQFLKSYGLIETSDDIQYFLPYVIDNTGCETAVAQRVREFRARQKTLQSNTDVTDVKRLCNVEIEKEIEKEIEIDNKAKNRFKKPSFEEVDSFIKEKKLNVDAKKFFDYFEAGNWIDSKGNKVKSWKQKLLTWDKYGAGSVTNKFNNATERHTDYDALFGDKR